MKAHCTHCDRLVDSADLHFYPGSVIAESVHRSAAGSPRSPVRGPHLFLCDMCHGARVYQVADPPQSRLPFDDG